MHQPYRAKFWRFIPHSPKPRDHFRPIGMCAIPVDDLNTGMERNVFAENVKNRLPLDYSATQGMLGLKTDDEDRVSGVAGTLGKMVKNPAVLHHA